MRFIHTSDLHIDSPLGQRLSPEKAAERSRELLYNLERLCQRARELSADAIVIAGDLFDKEKVTKRAKDTVVSCFTEFSDLSFFYLPGNHERNALTSERLPSNVKVFGKAWSYFSMNGVMFSGRSECSEGMFDTLMTDTSIPNVCVLHGELGSHSCPGVIGSSELHTTGIDYLALGHYHSYSERLFGKCLAVYSGTPEGRGFDEVGERGFSLVDIIGGKVTARFIPFAKRRIYCIDVPLDGCESTSDVSARVEAALAPVRRDDTVRLVLGGRCAPTLIKNVEGLSMRLSERYYCFELIDESGVQINVEELRYDKSLRGEFIRLVLGDEGLSDREKDRIIKAGLSALLGECAEGL